MKGKFTDATPIRWRYVTVEARSFHYIAESVFTQAEFGSRAEGVVEKEIGREVSLSDSPGA